jgi:hypothetical protein
MKRRTAKRQAHEKIKLQKMAGMKRPGGQSNYGRKKRFLDGHGGWGWEYSIPKPWKSM